MERNKSKAKQKKLFFSRQEKLRKWSETKNIIGFEDEKLANASAARHDPSSSATLTQNKTRRR